MKRTNNRRTNKSQKTRKSLKGNWGKVGAPPKNTKIPSRPFTMERLFTMNAKGPHSQCQLSLRNKVNVGLADGTIVALKPCKQPHGAVGRPKSVFVLKANFDPSTMELAAGQVTTVTVAAPAVAALPVTSAPVAEAVVALPLTPAPMTPAPAPASSVIENYSSSVPSSPAPAVPSAPVIG